MPASLEKQHRGTRGGPADVPQVTARRLRRLLRACAFGAGSRVSSEARFVMFYSTTHQLLLVLLDVQAGSLLPWRRAGTPRSSTSTLLNMKHAAL